MPSNDLRNKAALRIVNPVLIFLALASVSYGQPAAFMESFDGPTLDAAWETTVGDPAGHPTSIAGTYDIMDPREPVSPAGTKLRRSTAGTLSSYTHEIELTLDPFDQEGANTGTDFKFKSFGPDGFMEVVLNSFGSMRLFHNSGAMNPSGNIQPADGEDPINIEYVDGDVFKLTTAYDQAADRIDVSYSLNGGTVESFYSGNGIAGSIGDIITASVEVEVFKFGNNTDVATVSIDSWNLTTGAVVVTGLDCDSDGDDRCEQSDINAMYAAFGIGGGQFDYDGDNDVDQDDIGDWLAEASTSANLYNTGNWTFKPGDVNLDGTVNSSDLGTLLANFGSATTLNWGDGNLNGDGIIDSSDLGDLLSEFGFTSAAAAQAVPEPSGASLLLLTMVGLFAARRNRNPLRR